MIKIAFVGDIGSGKTYISNLFSYPIFNADSEVSDIYKTDINCFKKLNKKIPNFFKSFPVKKKDLVSAILSNNSNIKKISDIVHPIVRKKIKIFLFKNKKKKFVILDVPLYLENKLNHKNDIVIFVDSEKKEIDKRLKKRKNYNPKIINKLRNLQFSLSYKKKKSNFIIKNDFKNKNIKGEILEFLNTIN